MAALQTFTSVTITVIQVPGTTTRYTVTFSGTRAGLVAAAVINNARFNLQFLSSLNATVPQVRSVNAASALVAAWLLLLALAALFL